MINSLDEIPEYIEEEVRSRIAVNEKESTLIVDDSEEECIRAYTGFTDALEREYENACEKRGEDSIKVYHLIKEPSSIQLVRYENSKGVNEEKIWRESVQ